MMNLPPFETPLGNELETIKTWVPDALHFQRAIQNVRVRDMEVEIPVLRLAILTLHPSTRGLLTITSLPARPEQVGSQEA